VSLWKCGVVKKTRIWKDVIGMMNVKVKSERGGEGDCMNGTFQKAEILEYGTRMSELESW
jgi:hypothetical protein